MWSRLEPLSDYYSYVNPHREEHYQAADEGYSSAAASAIEAEIPLKWLILYLLLIFNMFLLLRHTSGSGGVNRF